MFQQLGFKCGASTGSEATNTCRKWRQSCNNVSLFIFWVFLQKNCCINFPLIFHVILLIDCIPSLVSKHKILINILDSIPQPQTSMEIGSIRLSTI